MNPRRCNGLRHTWKEMVRDNDVGPSGDGHRASRATVRAVALTFHDHMNGDGECFLSFDTLASETGLARATVIAAVAWLRETGWLTRKKRGGGRHANVYQVAFPTFARVVAAAAMASESKSRGPEADDSKSRGPHTQESRSATPKSRGPRPQVSLEVSLEERARSARAEPLFLAPDGFDDPDGFAEPSSPPREAAAYAAAIRDSIAGVRAWEDTFALFKPVEAFTGEEVMI